MKTDLLKEIQSLRQEIDTIDHDILDGINLRFEKVIQIANLKKELALEANQPERLQAIITEREKYIRNTHIPHSLLLKLIHLFHDEALNLQRDLLSD